MFVSLVDCAVTVCVGCSGRLTLSELAKRCAPTDEYLERLREAKNAIVIQLPSNHANKNDWVDRRSHKHTGNVSHVKAVQTWATEMRKWEALHGGEASGEQQALC